MYGPQQHNLHSTWSTKLSRTIYYSAQIPHSLHNSASFKSLLSKYLPLNTAFVPSKQTCQYNRQAKHVSGIYVWTKEYGARIAQSVVCWAHCPAWCYVVGSTLLWASDREHSCSRWVNASNKNTPSMHHPWRWNVTTSIVGLKKGHICKNLTKNGESQKRSWEHRRMKKKSEWLMVSFNKWSPTSVSIWTNKSVSKWLIWFQSECVFMFYCCYPWPDLTCSCWVNETHREVLKSNHKGLSLLLISV